MVKQVHRNLSKPQLKQLKDKAARIIMHEDNIVIELWRDDIWTPTWHYYSTEYDRCIIKIMQLLELKFEFEDLLVGQMPIQDEFY